MFTVYVYYMSANVTPGPVIALTKVVLETEIFRHRYLKYNNTTVKQYFYSEFLQFFHRYIQNTVHIILLGCLEF